MSLNQEIATLAARVESLAAEVVDLKSKIKQRDGDEQLTPAQACGILNCCRKTLDRMSIPRIQAGRKKAIRYLLADVLAAQAGEKS